MYLDSIRSLTGWQDGEEHWISKPTVDHDGVSIKLCQAIGSNAVTPNGASGQPLYHPAKSVYQFDESKFKGPLAKDDLVKMLELSCPGCTLYMQKNGSTTGNKKHYYQLRCNRYPTVHRNSQKFSDKERFTKDNVITESNKKSTSRVQSAFEKMGRKGGLRRPRVKQAVDRRKGKEKIQKPRNKRCSTIRAESPVKRCKMNIQFFMDEIKETWHLHSNSHLDHSFHVPEAVNATTLNKSDLNEEQLMTLNILFDSGVSPTTIAKAMTDAVNRSGRSGEFLASTIKNIGNQERAAMNKISGISSDWSQAVKIICTIQE